MKLFQPNHTEHSACDPSRKCVKTFSICPARGFLATAAASMWHLKPNQSGKRNNVATHPLIRTNANTLSLKFFNERPHKWWLLLLSNRHKVLLFITALSFHLNATLVYLMKASSELLVEEDPQEKKNRSVCRAVLLINLGFWEIEEMGRAAFLKAISRNGHCPSCYCTENLPWTYTEHITPCV